MRKPPLSFQERHSVEPNSPATLKSVLQWVGIILLAILVGIIAQSANSESKGRDAAIERLAKEQREANEKADARMSELIPAKTGQ